jgi:hypothetical protein
VLTRSGGGVSGTVGRPAGDHAHYRMNMRTAVPIENAGFGAAVPHEVGLLTPWSGGAT